MEILFGQLLDQKKYIDYDIPENQTSFNKAVVGPLGLLSILERDLGLSGDYMDAMFRVTWYSVALKEHLVTESDAFYAKAFSSDEMGVARDLLTWRDDLVMLGWKKLQEKDQPSRLKTLAQVEELFIDRYFHYGVADRWQDVLSHLPEDPGKLNCRIQVIDDPNLIHPFFQRLFEKLAGSIEYTDHKSQVLIRENNLGLVKKLLMGMKPDVKHLNPVSSDNSITILKVKDNYLSAELLANQVRQGFHPVVINPDNNIVDYFLTANGLPASGSELTNSNPLIIQLFKLAAVSLINPLNVYNLLSLLQSPYSPIPRSLASTLGRMLIEKPGIKGKAWTETVELYYDNWEEPDEMKRKKKRLETDLFLTFTFEELIDARRLKNIYSSLKGWSDKHLLGGIYDNSEEEKNQFAYLSKLCQNLLNRIQNETATIDPADLLKWIESIYEPAPFINEMAQVGSVSSIESPAGMIDTAPVVWWHECYNTIIRANTHGFLNSTESDYLKNNGLEMYSPANQVKLIHENQKKGILMARDQCVLVMVEKHYGEEINVHPLVSEIHAWFKNTAVITITENKIEAVAGKSVQLKPVASVQLPIEKAVWKINNPNRLHPREVESASSIEKLIYNPFEWVIKYQAMISEGSSFTLPDLFLLKGNISHAATEEIMTRKMNEADSILTDSLITDVLSKKIREEGLVFLLPEMRFEYEELFRKYRVAIKSLVSIIDGNQLKVVGCEEPVNRIIDGIGEVAGFIDLILEDGNGKKIILDLKWTKNNKKYQTKLEEGKAIQLAVYHAVLDGNPATAYFMFDSGKLYTNHNLIGDDVIVVNVAVELEEASVMGKTINSVAFRWEELNKGDIEIGENIPVDQLSYHTETENRELIPLDISKTDKTKYGDRYSGLEFFKGKIK
jgi:hypothetical protein